MNVIPKVGQVWIDRFNNENTVFRCASSRIHLNDGNKWVNRSVFCEDYTFKPANNLEYLAVNCEKWNDEYNFVHLVDGKICFTFRPWTDSHNKSEWEDKRIELYGDQIVNIDDIAKSEECEFKGGEQFFIAQMNPLASSDLNRYSHSQYWCDSGNQREYVKLGIAFKRKEDAVRKTKELLGIDTRTEQEKLIDDLRKYVSKIDAESMIREFNITRKDK